MDLRKEERNQRKTVQRYPSSSPMVEDNHLYLESLLFPENRRSFQFCQPAINPINGNPVLPNAACDSITLDADFNRLNLSTPSPSFYSLGFDHSFLQNNFVSDSSRLEYTNLNLQRGNVESAVMGQTGLSLEPHEVPDSSKEVLEGFRRSCLNPNSKTYNPLYHNMHSNNGGGYGGGGFNIWNPAIENRFLPAHEMGDGAPSSSNNRNGFQSVYDTGHGAPANSNGNGFPPFYDLGYGASSSNNRSGFRSAYGVGYGDPINSNGNGFHSVYDVDYGAPINSNRNGFQVDNSFRRRGRPRTRFDTDNSGGWMASSPNHKENNHHLSSSLERLGTRPFEQWRGNIVYMAKDQHGYAFLKKKIEEGKEEEIEIIFMEVSDHVRELMVNQYGNYPIQKIFEVCSVDQMTQMLRLVVSDERYLMSICVDTHGTRAMQKMLEHISLPEQVTIVMAAITHIAFFLTKSMAGYRVIERCLKSFTNEQNRQLLRVVADNCAEIAMDKAGCCALQACLNHSEGESRHRLITVLIANTLLLSEDIYGNFVVQCILGMKVPHYTEGIMAHLRGNYISLSLNKYASNVVEKAIVDSDIEQRARIMLEIVNSPNFLMVLQDPFGNYVTQTALDVAEGPLRRTIVSLIELHYPYLHSHPHGKRVLAKARGNGRNHHRGHERKR